MVVIWKRPDKPFPAGPGSGEMLLRTLACPEAQVAAQGLNLFRSDALVTTETELRAIAAAAIMGLRSQFVRG